MKNVELLSRTVYKVQTAIRPMEKVLSESKFINRDTIWSDCESVDVIRGILVSQCEGDTNGIMYLN